MVRERGACALRHTSLRRSETARGGDRSAHVHVTLRSLDRDGSRMGPKVPPRVEYTLTPLALTLRGSSDS